MKLNSIVSALMFGTLISSASIGVVADESSSVQEHLDSAYALAGDSNFMRKMVDLQCTDNIDPMSFFKNASVPPATKAFDNLYFVGLSSVTAWALKTSKGIILIDALNNTKEAETVIEPGLVALGLDPADIKYIVVTHGHGDHYGGASYLAKKYNARVLMSEQDWDLAAAPRIPQANDKRPLPNWSPAPKKDMVATDGQLLTLGDTTLRIVATPGHTPGTISVLFPVFSNGERHMAALWGGTGFPRDVEGVKQYVASSNTMTDLLANQKVDVALSNHPFVDDSIARMQTVDNSSSSNPLVIGVDGVQRFAKILLECAKLDLAEREIAVINRSLEN